MSRAVWFAAGAGAGVYALLRARRAAEALTPEGLGDRLAALTLGLRMFRDEVATGMGEKENDLRERLVVALPRGTRPELSGGDVARATPAPDNSVKEHREGND